MSWKPHVERDAAMKLIKEDLLRWTCERHATDCPLDRRFLRDKALELASKYGLTGFNCSKMWLTRFLKKHGFSLNLENCSGPIFSNYRLWIDMIRSIITQYKYKNLFHLDELTMYSDISPIRISSAVERDESDILRKATVLMCCNASGTEKLPLLICGSYPAAITDEDHVYSHSEDASINDNLFREWLVRLNDRILSSGRKILLLLHRNRVNAIRDLELSNVRHVFFPDDFPPLLRPLKRDVFHFVKMVYRNEYVKGIGECGRQWNVENVVRSLMKAWQKVPRNLIIASFQRTSFRTDDCFLEMHCAAWEDLKTGVSFRKFVTFDDDLSVNALDKQCKSTDKSHGYNLRTREIIRLTDDQFNPAIEQKNPINNHLEVIDNQIIRSTIQSSGIEEIHSTRAIVSDELITSGTNVICDEVEKTTNSKDGSENGQAASSERSIGSPSEVVNTNSSAVTSQQVSNDTSAADLDIKESDAEVISCATARDETESINLDGNDNRSFQKLLKRKRSHSAGSEETRDNSSDDEPQRKRSKSDFNWTKQYETTFVFGSSDSARAVPAVSVDTPSDNDVR
nr:PREDICTED: tigger transposable element-derived protein 6-like [Linepithema humile]